MKERVRFLKVEIKVYPASVEGTTDITGIAHYDWDTELVAKEAILESIINLVDWCDDTLTVAITDWVDREILLLGRRQVFQLCPEDLPPSNDLRPDEFLHDSLGPTLEYGDKCE